jgi:hypothetical protein
MMLFSYKKSSKGRQRGEFPLGQIDWEGKPVVTVRDRTLREQLREYFQQPIWVPIPLGDEDNVMGHTWECLQPGDEEHFLEAVKRLHQKDMVVDLDS